MTSTHLTLIQSVKDPTNENAWERFAETYSAYIDQVLKKTGVMMEEIKDLRQDILLKLWKNLPEFDYEPNKAMFRTWLYKVIRNTAYNHASSRESEKHRVEQYFQVKSEGKEMIDEILEEEWQEFLCQTALKNLSESFTEKSIMIFQDALSGKSVTELASTYQLKENTVYRIKNRVKERLILEIQRLRKELE